MGIKKRYIWLMLITICVTCFFQGKWSVAETSERMIKINGEEIVLQPPTLDLISSIKMSNTFGVNGNKGYGHIKPIEGVFGYEVFFSDPGGMIHAVPAKLNQNSYYHEFSFPLDQVGKWTLEAVKTIHSDGFVYYDGVATNINLECVDSLAAIYGSNDYVLDDDALPDNSTVSQTEFIKAIGQVRGYDTMGNPLEVQVDITGDGYDNSYQIFNDGLSITYGSLSDSYPSAGTYDLRFSLSNGETINKTIQVTASDFQTSAVALSGSMDIVERLAGDNRAGTAVEISKETYEYAENVVLVNGYNFPDALTADSLACELNAPILFAERDYLDSKTYEELIRLGTETIYVVGGDSVISDAMLESSLSEFTINRIQGSNRYGTAIQTAKELMKTNKKTTAILVSGDNFPDALSAGPYSGEQAYPILYSPVDALELNTKDFLSNNGFKDVIVVGGTAVISEDIVQELEAMGISVQRIAGANRYETSYQFAKTYYPNATAMLIASGENYPDAIAGGPLAASLQAPILLTYHDLLADQVSAAINERTIEKVYLLGGEAALSSGVMNAVGFLFLSTGCSSPISPPELVPVQNPDGSYQLAKVTIVEKRIPTKNCPIRILLDAGHIYGVNQSPVAPGYNEGEAMYYYAYILKSELEKYGFFVDLTRKDIESEKIFTGIDTAYPGLTLMDRGNKGLGFDLLLMLHSNAMDNDLYSTRGSEIFDSATMPRKDLADLLVKSIADTFGHTNRGTKYRILDNNMSFDYGLNWYSVLRNSKATHSMLVEHGFHDNFQDVSLLMSPSFLMKLAQAEAKVLADYYGMPAE